MQIPNPTKLRDVQYNCEPVGNNTVWYISTSCQCVRVCISLCSRAHVYADGCPDICTWMWRQEYSLCFLSDCLIFKLLLLLLLSFFVCMCVCRGLNMIWFLTATVKGICEPDHSNPHSCLRSTQPQSHFSGFFFKHGFRGLSMCPCACKASTLLTDQNKYTTFEDGRSYI